MPTHALDLRGIDQLPDGGWRVRMMFHGERFTEVVATLDAAFVLRNRWRELRRNGLAPERSAPDILLGTAMASLLDGKRHIASSTRRRKVSPRTIEDWERKTKPWRTGPLATMPVSMLRVAHVRPGIRARAKVAPTAARTELEGLKAGLREAESMGATVDPALYRIEPIPVERARLQALTPDELRAVADAVPDYAQALILFLGTTGLRLMEAFTLTWDRVDLDAAHVFIPAELCKERRDKWVGLTREEVALLRRLSLAAGRPDGGLVFTKAEGGQWQHRHWWKLIVKPIRRDTHLDGFRGHWLRATAATLMRDAGYSREDTATRLGHDDADTRLLDALYDQGDRAARVRRAIDAKTPRGLLADAGKVAPHHATTTRRGAVLRHGHTRAEALGNGAR